MQDTNKYEITSGYFNSSQSLTNFLISFLNVSHFKNVTSDVRSNYNRIDVIKLLVFSKYLANKSVYSLVNSDLQGIINCGKDVYYSIKNNIKINWRLLMLNHAMDCIGQMEDIDMTTTVSHRVPCLIVDDTDVPKKGKFIEMIGKIFSHTGRNYKLGFKSLNLCYWTGKTIINLDYSLHVEKRKDGNQGLTKKGIKQRYSKDRPNDTHGANRLAESLCKKTTTLIQMVKRSLDKGLEAKYLLVDSWFFNNELVTYISQTSLDLITRPKMNNWKYDHRNSRYTINQLLNKYKNHTDRKWSRKLQMYYIKVDVHFKENEMSLYFYKPKKRGSKWQILIGTQKSLHAIKTYELYRNRWSIEVAYKELKQNFNYGKCQSRDFSGQIADHTICLMAYNFMSIHKCVNDYESIGALFEDIKQNWIRPTIMEGFWKTIITIVEKLVNIFNLNMDEVLEKVISHQNFFDSFDLNRLNSTTET